MKKGFLGFFSLILVIAICCTCAAETVFPPAEKQTFKIVVKAGANDIGTNYGDKVCCKTTEAETNVAIDWVAYASGTYNEKVPLLIGSGDLPDAFSGGSVNVQTNYESYMNIEPYLEQYMPAWNAFLNANPVMKDALTMSDGGIYCLPVGDTDYGTYYAGGMLYVNDTFVANYLNGKVPATLDELYQALVIASANDINGNGIKDEIPLLACDDYKCGLDSMFSYFGIGIDGNYIMYSDNTCSQVEFVANTAAYKEALTTLRKWYSEGLINGDVYSMSNADFTSRYQESTGVAFVITHTPDFNFADGLKNWSLVTYLENGDYQPQFVAEGSFGTLEGFVITKACEQPELLCAWLDYIHSDFERWAQWSYGEKGKIWDYAEDGKHYVSYLMGEAKASGLSYGKWRQTYAAHTGGPKYGGMYQSLMTYAPAELVKGGSRNYFVNQMAQEIKPENTKFSVVRQGYWDEEKSEQLDEMDLAIKEYCAAFKAKAIVNGFTDDEWNAYCETLKNGLHVEEYIALYNEYFARNN